MARPTKNNPKGEQKSPKLTPETIRKLEGAFAIDATVGEACYYANISQDTYYRWIKKFPELSEKFKRLRQKPILTARQEVVKGLANNPEFSLKYLERKKKDEFSLRTEVSGIDGKDLIPEKNEQVKVDQAISIYLNEKNNDTTDNKGEEADED